MSFDLKLTNFDLTLNNGELNKVEEGEKLIQDILKICMTDTGANPLHPNYGSFLSQSVVGSPINTDALLQIAKSQLYGSLENLQTLQDAQVKSFQRLSPDEQLSSILDISILRSQVDFRLINVRIRVLSKGFKALQTSFNVSSI